MSNSLDMTNDFSDCRTLPYDIFGVKLWSVESTGGYIHKYCDTKEQAQEYIAKTYQNPELIENNN